MSGRVNSPEAALMGKLILLIIVHPSMMGMEELELVLLWSFTTEVRQ